jgi:RNA polymerase sigma-70 factor (ECF subfamily)
MDAATAANQLFHDYKTELYRYALFVLGNPDDAEDVLQEVFLRVLRYWDGFRQDASAKTWLWRILKNCVTDTIRKRQRSGKHTAQLDVDLVESGAPADSLVEWEGILRVLSHKQRQVVYLRVIADYSTAETAELLGYTTGTVRVVLHRAVSRLRKHVQADWFATAHNTALSHSSSITAKRDERL